MRIALLRIAALLLLTLFACALAFSCHQPPEPPPQEDPEASAPPPNPVTKPPLSCEFIGDGNCPPDGAPQDAGASH